VRSAGERRAKAAQDAHLAIGRGPDGALIVELSGAWRLQRGLPEALPVERALAEPPRPPSLGFDVGGLAHWDTLVLAFIGKVEEAARRQDVPVDRSGLPQAVRRLLALTEAVPEREGGRPLDIGASWLERVGMGAGRAWDASVEALAFVGEAVAALGRFVTGRAHVRWRDFALLVQECGAQALPIVTLITFISGVIVAFVGAVQLQRFGATLYVADLVALATAREIGALMTAVVMAGRTGSGYAAQLGTMQVNQEIEALETMGLAPMEFLVVPRLLAMSVMMPLLCLYADAVTWIGGAAIGVGMLDLNPTLYWLESQQAVTMTDVTLGIVKSLVFGVLIAVAGCMQGMRAERNAAAVGQAATSAVVLSIVAIVVADGLFAVLCNALGI
jgi:phospholipid/cholesterol/gamma-HCH transport system permease protein